MDPDLDEQEVETARLDNKRECHWRIFSEDNDGEVDKEKEILHDQMWDVYMNYK